MKIFFLMILGLSLLQADYIRDDTKDVVIDTTTNLMWQDDADADTITRDWVGAIDYCETSALGGFNDWRLPSFNELYLLVDISVYNPAISSIFINVISSDYWSSTTYAPNTTNAWLVNFYSGFDTAGTKTVTGYVRCVR